MNLYTRPIVKSPCILLLAGVLPLSLAATPTTISQKVAADTYVSSGQPTANFGTMGAMEIAVPTSSQNRTEESLVRFSTASVKSAFDADYGAGNWTITAITLQQYSNFSAAGQQPGNSSFNKIAAGGFELDWLSNVSWSETAITWNTLSTVLPGTGTNQLVSLGDFYWAADGSSSQLWNLSLASALVDDIARGGDVTLFGQPTAGVIQKPSTQVWSFNGIAAGTAGWFRFIASPADAGALLSAAPWYTRLDGSIAVSGGDAALSNITVAIGAPNTIDTFKWTQPLA